jgi:hypothetical protein
MVQKFAWQHVAWQQPHFPVFSIDKKQKTIVHHTLWQASDFLQ